MHKASRASFLDHEAAERATNSREVVLLSALKSGEGRRLTSKRPVAEKIHIAVLDGAENRTEESSRSLFNL